MEKTTEEEIMRKCSCGEEFDFEGWNVKGKEDRMGNAYHLRRAGDYRVKYTLCDKCGKKVTLSKDKFC